jgi:hypothetical protein
METEVEYGGCPLRVCYVVRAQTSPIDADADQHCTQVGFRNFPWTMASLCCIMAAHEHKNVDIARDVDLQAIVWVFFWCFGVVVAILLSDISKLRRRYESSRMDASHDADIARPPAYNCALLCLFALNGDVGSGQRSGLRSDASKA